MRIVEHVFGKLRCSTTESFPAPNAVFVIKDTEGNKLHVPLWFDHEATPREAQIIAEARFRETISRFGTPRGKLTGVSCAYWRPSR